MLSLVTLLPRLLDGPTLLKLMAELPPLFHPAAFDKSEIAIFHIMPVATLLVTMLETANGNEGETCN